MKISALKSGLLDLSKHERQRLIAEVQLKDKEGFEAYSCRQSHRKLLDNKQGFVLIAVTINM